MEPIRILVLEDDNSLREILADLIREQGHEVEAVGRGEDAVRLAHESPFDLVITDIRMEGMSGLDALAQIKQHQPDLGSLVVTGYSTEEDSIRAIRLGVGEYLKKPFDLSDFLKAVEALIAKRRQAQRIGQEEENSERAARWGVEMLVRSLDGDLESQLPANPPFSLFRASELAGAVLEGMDLGGNTRRQIQTACLVAAVDRYLGLESWEFPDDALGPGVQRVLHHVNEHWDGSGQPLGLEGRAIPVGSRVVAAVLSCYEGGSAAPGALDPDIAERVNLAAAEVSESGEGEPEAVQMDAGRRRRGLLSLGRGLEESRRFDAARQAYEQIIEETDQTREGVEAIVGLGRLARVTGRPQEILALSQRAIAAGHQVGPVTVGWAGLKFGLLLMMTGQQQGLHLLQQADRMLGELRIPSGKALTSLALHRFGAADPSKLEASLNVLGQPEYLSDLTENAEWMIPYLLNLQANIPHPRFERTLLRMARECPKRFKEILQRPLTSREKVAAVKALAQAGGTNALELIQLLTSDPNAEVRQAANQVAREKEADSTPLLRIYTLGGFEVYLGEDRLDNKWRGKQLSFLLAYIAANGPRPIPEERVIDSFWPKDATRGKKNLGAAISHLRRHLTPKDSKTDTLIRGHTGLHFAEDYRYWHDFTELQRLLDETQQHHKDGATQKMLESGRQVARLYRGPYLEGCYMEWAVEVRNDIERSVADVLRKLATSTQKAGNFQEALEYSRAVLELDPYCQEGHLACMQACIELGRPEEAVRQYEICKTRLERDLEMEPSIAILEAHQRALLSV